ASIAVAESPPDVPPDDNGSGRLRSLGDLDAYVTRPPNRALRALVHPEMAVPRMLAPLTARITDLAWRCPALVVGSRFAPLRPRANSGRPSRPCPSHLRLRCPR